MIESELLEELGRIVGADYVATDRLTAEVYSYDASLATGAPDAVVFPSSTAETAAVVGAVSKAGVPCTPRGFGTNLSGGSVAPEGGVVVCLTRMNRILSVQPEHRSAAVQPGVTNFELQQALAPLGFFFAPDPSSQKVATFGGNVAENAGGPHCVKYGVTTDHILGMEVVLPDGEIVRFGGAALDPPGYDLRGLMVGSEGTLGIVTEVTVRILPQAESIVTMLAIYDTVSDAANSVSQIIANGIVPATLEMMDAPVIRAVEERYASGYPTDAAAVLIIEVEGLAAGLRTEADTIQDVCRANGCRSIQEARNDAERDQLWSGRRGAFGALSRIAPNFYSADCTVPRTRLPDALERVAEIAQKHGFEYANVLHAGDGNLHPVLFFDGRAPGQLELVHKAGEDIIEACVALGGTITGEHGIGVEKMDAMCLLFSDDDLYFQRTVRRVFDPAATFNPGKMFPEPSHTRGDDVAEVARLPAGVAEVARLPTDGSRVPNSCEFGYMPSSAAEACEIVRDAGATRTPVLPVGRGTHTDFGNASNVEPVALRSEKLSGVIDYDPPSQVVTLGAGMTLAATQELLAEHNQWLPVRPPLGDGCTLGGLVALGTCGPERLCYGAPRDLVLGLRFVSGEGWLITAGGRVVKNVAGYDITRLLVGSAGTLGFFTEVTLLVSTMPEATRAVRAHGSPQACAAAAAEVLRSNLQPAFVSAVPLPDDSPDWELKLGFEGLGVTVEAQIERCGKLVAEAGGVLDDAMDYPSRDGTQMAHFGALHDSPFVLGTDVPLANALTFVSNARPVLAEAKMLVDFGCGRVTAGLSSLSDADWARLCTLAAGAGGHVILQRAPHEFKSRHDVFGLPRPEWQLMHRLKKAFDPNSILAPGRLPGVKRKA